jgi:hypothetical protein
MRQLFTWLWCAEAPPFTIDNTRRKAFLKWLAECSGIQAERIGRDYGGLFESLFKEIEDELGRVAIADLVPRYVGHLLLVSS